MKVHEHQAKVILGRYGVPVPRGGFAASAADAGRIARDLGGRVVVKSQIHAGGRGKGKFRDAAGRPVLRPGSEQVLGGVLVVDGAKAAEDVASRMIGSVLVTKQTGPDGRIVRGVLVEEAMEIRRELYLAVLLDRAVRAPVFIASAEGGTDIEEVAAARPDAIVKTAVDPASGYFPWVGRRIAFALGMEPAEVAPAAKLVEQLHRAFLETDASLAEINPLVVTGDGRVLALDAKMTFDDNALYRHEDVKALRDLGEEDPLEVEASKFGLNYIKLDGNVACMVNGAGLAMATMDIIKHHGGSPANFLDVGGGATAEMVTNAFRILLEDKGVRAVLVNIFGGIMRCDVVADGVVKAARAVGVKVPVVVRLEGTNVEQGQEILRTSGLDFLVADGMKDAAEKVVRAAAGR
jgi:succinyl-CoA synthetase beta subunit